MRYITALPHNVVINCINSDIYRTNNVVNDIKITLLPRFCINALTVINTNFGCLLE